MRRKRDFKRLVVVSDFHCGHLVGLTPPQWWITAKKAGEEHYPSAIRRTQKRMWGGYVASLNELKPIDVLVVNGDCIDGKGPRSGGTELITADREVQAKMAAQCIAQAQAKQVIMTYGTAYHAGDEEDWENIVASDVKADKIGSHEWIDIEGQIFDFKHKISRSTIPHGRHTAVARDRLWNLLWAERREQPKASVIVRSHVHYYNHCGGHNWLAMTTPALQAAGTKFGARMVSGVVDLGFVHFDVYPGGFYTWEPHFLPRAVRRATALKVR